MKNKNKVSAHKVSTLLNSLDLNETLATSNEAVRVGKAEYTRTFNSDFFLNMEHAGLAIVKALVAAQFQGLENKIQYRVDYNIESREFSVTVRAKQRIAKLVAA